jgi:hypothetical protein
MLRGCLGYQMLGRVGLPDSHHSKNVAFSLHLFVLWDSITHSCNTGSFFHRRHLRVLGCIVISLMRETPPCIRSIVVVAGAGDPSAHHSCYLGSVVDAGDTSVHSWFHLGDSSIVGGVAVVAPVKPAACLSFRCFSPTGDTSEWSIASYR